MRAPIGVASRKSNGVPSTSAMPVGMRPASIGRKQARVQRELVVERAATAREVPVRVVGEVDDGRPVRRRAVVDAPFVRRGQRVAHRHVEPAGVVLVAVLARQRQLERDAAVGLRRQRLDRPPALAEAARPAVQSVRAVVARQRVGLAVEREAAVADAVGVAADERAEVRIALFVVGERVEAEDDVGAAAGAVGAAERRDDAAVVDRLQHQAAAVVERVLDDLAAVGEAAVGARRRHRSDPAAIDDEVLRRAHRAVVGREEERHVRDVLGCSGRLMHWPRAMSCLPRSSSQRRICFAVITQPGTRVLTRMSNGPRSRARLRVSPCTADFDVV
jgi:hypothetical protein